MTWTTRLRSDFAGLSAIAAGSGPKILLIHGVGLRSEAWNSQIDALSAGYHTVAIDMLGHGASPLPKGELGLADYTDAIVAGLETPALVIGHSMGAMIALDMATRYPHVVRGVAALNAIFDRVPAAQIAVQTRAASLDGISAADPEHTLERWFGDLSSPEKIACRDWLLSVDPGAYRIAYSTFARENGPSREALTTLGCPALFLTGSEERNSTPEMSHAMAALTPKARAHIIKDAAHMMPMTHANEVNDALLDFAKEVFE